MLKKILFTVFLYNSICLVPQQQKDIIIPFSKNSANVIETDILINGYNSRFIFDTGASNVSFGKNLFDELVSKKILSKNDILRRSKTILANGNEVDVLIINIKELTLGNSFLNNIEATVVDGTNVPLLLGQSALEKYGTITIDNQKNVIILKVKKQKPSSTISLENLKIVPCFRNATKEIGKLKEALKTSNFLVNITEIEKKIPPIKARYRLKSKVTIRYFSKKDSNKAEKIKQSIIGVGYKVTVGVEDMTPYFKNEIPNYIEVWLKK